MVCTIVGFRLTTYITEKNQTELPKTASILITMHDITRKRICALLEKEGRNYHRIQHNCKLTQRD